MENGGADQVAGTEDESNMASEIIIKWQASVREGLSHWLSGG